MEQEQTLLIEPNTATDPDGDLIAELKAVGATESKFSSLTLLIVTVILFFSSQIVSLTWQEILIGVLFFHELGHLAAMKLFRYNDVKMFFIPFLGASRHRQSQGWVSEALPFPDPRPRHLQPDRGHRRHPQVRPRPAPAQNRPPIHLSGAAGGRSRRHLPDHCGELHGNAPQRGV